MPVLSCAALPCVAEGDGCVEYPVAGTQVLAEVCQVRLHLDQSILVQPTVCHGVGQHQDAEVGRVRAGNLQVQQHGDQSKQVSPHNSV